MRSLKGLTAAVTNIWSKSDVIILAGKLQVSRGVFWVLEWLKHWTQQGNRILLGRPLSMKFVHIVGQSEHVKNEEYIIIILRWLSVRSLN